MYECKFLTCHTRRNPREYFAIFDGIETKEPDGRHAHFELLSCKPVDAYCRIKKNQNQVRTCCSALPWSGRWHPNNRVPYGRLPESKVRSQDDFSPSCPPHQVPASGCVSLMPHLQPLAAAMSFHPRCAPLQICWKWRKVVTDEPQRDNFRAFLDGVQYSRTGILRYERIFGPGFVSTGGLETTKVCRLPSPTSSQLS